MKKYKVLMLLWLCWASLPLFAQEPKNKGAGFGIEAGFGYNYMKYTLTSVAGGDSTAILDAIWVQPCFRLHYDVWLKQLGEKNSLFLKPFLSYYTFGGMQPADANGSKISLSFSSIEAGVGLAFDFIKKFQLTPLVKAQYIISAKERHILANQRGVPTKDIKAGFKEFSTNAGLQFRFRYRHFTIGLEGWLGLTNFNKAEGKTAKENNYRLLLGYEF